MSQAWHRRGRLSALRERWWLVILPLVVGAVLAGALASSQTKIYEAQADVLFQPAAFDQLLFGQTVFAQPPATPTTTIDTDIRLLGEETVATAVIGKLNLHTTPTALRKQISIAEQTDSNVATLRARDSNPARAAAIADAWVDSYLTLQKAANQQPLIAAAKSLRAQVGSLPSGPRANTSRTRLQSRLNEIVTLTQLQTAGAQVVRHATPPTSPVSPTPRLDALIGGIAGLGFGVILAFVAAALDLRIKTLDEAEVAYGLPVLATITHHSDRDKLAGVPWRANEEGFRLLRSQIGFFNLGREKPVKTILIASAQPADGKSTVCAGLGFAAASSGQRVVCMDGDLRRPTLPSRLGCEPPPRGIIDALFDGKSPQSALVDVPLPTAGAQALPSGQEPGSLRLLSVGLIPPNPAELISSDPFRAAVVGVADDSSVDLVLIDSPPLVAVADAAVLAQLCDAVVLVLRSHHSSSQVATRVMTILGRTETAVLGLVVVDVRSPLGAYGQYDYSGSDSPPSVRLHETDPTTPEVELPDPRQVIEQR